MALSHTYKTIIEPSKGIYSDKGSKFIAYAYPVSSEKGCKEYTKLLRSEHAGARHFCYAYRIGSEAPIERSNDDGEPSGTAGKPILNQLLSLELTEICIIVVRYFGGTLLGTTGLIQAYKEASKEALMKSTIIEKEITLKEKLTITYPIYNNFMRLVKKYDIKTEMLLSTDHDINFELTIPKRIMLDFNEAVEQLKKNT